MANARMGRTLRLAARSGRAARRCRARSTCRCAPACSQACWRPGTTHAVDPRHGIQASAIARASVVAAYEQLLAEGYVEGRARIGHLRLVRISTGLVVASGAARPTVRQSATDAGRRRRPSPSSRNRPRKPTRGRSTPAARWSTRVPSTIWRKLTHRAVRTLGPAGPRLHGSLRPRSTCARSICDYLTDRARRALRARADRHHSRDPARDRYRHPRAARARRRGVGRGPGLLR